MTIDSKRTIAGPVEARERVDEILSRLIAYYGLSPEAEPISRLFGMIGQESLRGFSLNRDCPFSAVNGNGFPVQFSVSIGARTRSLRCLGEVGAPGMSMPERLRLSTLRLREILAFLDRRSAVEQINRLFAILFPEDPTAVMHWTGGVWMALGASPRQPLALRLYVNQRWGDVSERYLRIGRAFAALGRGRSLEDWRRVAGPVSAGALPYGVAFDVVPGGVGRFKVYFASERADRHFLRNLFTLLGLERHLDRTSAWLDRFGLEQPKIDPGGFMPSLEFAVDPAEPVGLKLDVSCRHLHASDAQIDEEIRSYLQDFSFDSEEYRTALGLMGPGPPRNDRVERIQYFGVGFQGGDAERFNVYLCPDVEDPSE